MTQSPNNRLKPLALLLLCLSFSALFLFVVFYYYENIVILFMFYISSLFIAIYAAEIFVRSSNKVFYATAILSHLLPILILGKIYAIWIVLVPIIVVIGLVFHFKWYDRLWRDGR